MDFLPAVDALFWITFWKIIIGLMLLGVIVGSIYRFKGLVITVMGLLLLSNVICLIIIAGLT